MIDRKGHVLPLLRGMTILTQIPRPAAHMRLALAWYDTARGTRALPKAVDSEASCGPHDSGNSGNHRSPHTGRALRPPRPRVRRLAACAAGQLSAFAPQ